MTAKVAGLVARFDKPANLPAKLKRSLQFARTFAFGRDHVLLHDVAVVDELLRQPGVAQRAGHFVPADAVRPVRPSRIDEIDGHGSAFLAASISASAAVASSRPS